MTAIRSAIPPRIPSPSTGTVTQQPTFAPQQATQDEFELAQATQTLLANFKQASGSFFGGGTIDMNDLYAAANGQRGPQVQQAAQFLLQHPAMVQALDARKNGQLDGKISQNDLKLAMNDAVRQVQVDQLRYDPRLSTFAQSVATLANYAPMADTAAHSIFSGADGKISQNDLNHVITGNQYPPELRQAAFFLTMNPDLMQMIDTANKGGQPDGIISRNDLQVMLGQLQNVQSTLPSMS
jgi:hypothetical protein